MLRAGQFKLFELKPNMLGKVVSSASGLHLLSSRQRIHCAAAALEFCWALPHHHLSRGASFQRFVRVPFVFTSLKGSVVARLCAWSFAGTLNIAK